jgi:3-methyladenine DNA glycosylase AlkD
MGEASSSVVSSKSKSNPGAGPRRTPKLRKPARSAAEVRSVVAETMARLDELGTSANREGMARYGITAKKVFGVSVADLRAMGKELGRDSGLARAFWKAGYHETRMLAAFVEDPAAVTSEQMESWALDFENWADCDTVCFHLFEKTALAREKVAAWSERREELVKRAAFSLLAALAVHDKKSPDGPYVEALQLATRAAEDDRHLVKKAVSWALRSIGARSTSANQAALAVARKLASSSDPSSRWIGRDAVKGLTSDATQKRLVRGDERRKRSSGIPRSARSE